jgi:ferredoxin
MIASMARFGGGLPAHVLPFAVNQITATGLEALLAAAAYGAEYIYILVGPEKANEMNEVHSAITLANFILNNIGYGEDRISAIDELDPDAVSQHLYSCEARPGMPNADFISMGRKRSIMNQALHSLHINAENPVDVIALPEGAPFGSIEVDIDGCTLCLACVGACPTGAMKDNPETPQLSFNEQSCVQCGLCKKTCPENVISLKPQISFLEAARTYQVVKEEEPFECVRCSKPFGTKSTIEKMTSKLKGHPMFTDDKALDRLRMCEDCRVIALTENDSQPMAFGTVPIPRTTDDYLMERESLRKQAETDMRDKNRNVPEKNET